MKLAQFKGGIRTRWVRRFPIVLLGSSILLRIALPELEAHRDYLRLDDYYARVLTLKELPSETRPLLLNGLLDSQLNVYIVVKVY